MAQKNYYLNIFAYGLAVFFISIAFCPWVLGQSSFPEESIDEVTSRLGRAEALASLCHWELDLVENVLTFSDSVISILGLSSKTLTNDDFEAMLVGGLPETRRIAQKNLIEDGRPYDLELQVHRPSDGKIIDIHSVGMYVPETNTIFGTFLDITGRKVMERALVATQRRDRYLAIIALAFQTVIISVLLVNVQQKRRVQAYLYRNWQRKESLVRIFHQETDSLRALMDFALQEAMSLTNSDGGCICLYDEKTQIFTMEVCSSSFSLCSLDDIENLKIRAVKEKRSLLDNRYSSSDVNRYMLVPVFENEKVVALVGLINKRSNYHDRDLEQISAMMTGAWSMIARKQNSISLDEERKRLRTTLLSVGDGVITTDHQGIIEMMNPEAERLTGWVMGEAQGEFIEKVFPIRTELHHPVYHVLSSGEELKFEPEIVLSSKSGYQLVLNGSAAPVKDCRDNVIGVVLVFRDVTAEWNQRERIEYLSYHDPLTGLYNRRFLAEQLEIVDRQEHLPLSMIVADVKGLRMVNDALGHLIGDQLLQRVAVILRKNCRAKYVVARWGGDEFVILLPKTGEHEAIALTRRLELAFSNERIASVSISLAFGWGTKYHCEEDIADIFKQAEKCMYRAKFTGKPSVSDDTIQVLMGALYERSEREESHSQRVSQLSLNLGRELGLSAQEQAELKVAGLFHDIGKISIDGELLNKPGALTPEEWIEVKGHPESGYRILNSIAGMGIIAEAVLSHHERWDGSGYPRGIKGEHIPFMSRIIAVADAYDAMISVRPYRLPLSRKEALEELRRCAGTDFDPKVVAAFLRLIAQEQIQA